MALSDAELARHAHQLPLPGFGPATQELIRAARVHVVGAGEVAGPALLYLASAGVGTLYVDDGLDVGAEDAAAWLYPAAAIGQPRVLAAIAALRGASSASKARAFATGCDPTAALVGTASPGVAREAAERARSAGLPHVVAVVDGDGGEIVTIPRGAPCYACSSRPGTGAPARPGAGAAVGILGAMELLLVLTGALREPRHRRIEVVLGQTVVRSTTGVPGCPCTQGWPR